MELLVKEGEELLKATAEGEMTPEVAVTVTVTAMTWLEVEVEEMVPEAEELMEWPEVETEKKGLVV